MMSIYFDTFSIGGNGNFISCGQEWLVYAQKNDVLTLNKKTLSLHQIKHISRIAYLYWGRVHVIIEYIHIFIIYLFIYITFDLIIRSKSIIYSIDLIQNEKKITVTRTPPYMVTIVYSIAIGYSNMTHSEYIPFIIMASADSNDKLQDLCLYGTIISPMNSKSLRMLHIVFIILTTHVASNGNYIIIITCYTRW